ncbi:hypothetical protein HPB47_016216 [Ixodes persulcatus]|uniref:Uncharacterized protein n=1 Tax=Ixodes persulcatus TaxID=34615 RepID=A0AC60QTV2_IXOPE|nr:hypothetical protein HPB47_016216 [Ixodes persulcatus]
MSRQLAASYALVLRHVVSFKHQGEQARPGEQATPQELARGEPPELFLMHVSNMEQVCAAEAQLKDFTNRTLPASWATPFGEARNDPLRMRSGKPGWVNGSAALRQIFA